MKFFKAVQNRLFILFLIVAAIPVTMLAATLLIYNTTHLKNYALSGNKITAQTTAAFTQQFLNHAKEDIEGLAKSNIVVSAMKRWKIASLNDSIENFSYSHNFFTGVGIIDTKGYIRAIFPKNLATIGDNWRYYKYFTEVTKTGKTYFSDLIPLDMKQRQMIVVVATPVRDINGSILGLTFGHIDLTQFTKTLKNANIGRSGKAILVDRTGAVISHPDPKMITKDIKRKNNWVTQALSGKSGVTEEVSADKKILVAYEPVSNVGWAVGVEEPLADALGIFLQTKWLILLVGILSGMVVFVLSFLAGKHFSKPISQLSKGAELITQGNWNLNLEIRTGDEIEELAKQFNQMATKLNQSYASLEEKVKARTKELETVNRQLSNAKAKMEAVFRQAADGLMVIDEDGKIIEFNPVMEQLTGWKAYEAKGKYCYEILKLEDKMENNVCYNSCPLVGLAERDNSVTKTDINIRHKSGATIDISYTIAPFWDQRGELGSAVVTIRDMRNIKELERLKDQFVAIVSHELRSPMTSIKGWVSMLLEGSLGQISEEQREYLEEIQRNNERLLNLVEDMLDISKIEQDKLTLNIEPCNVTEILRKTINEMRILAKEKSLSLEFREADLPPVLADKDRIVQVLFNLIDNAIKFTDQGKITAWSQQEGSNIITHISDTGCGISSENLLHIFDKFFRTQTQQFHMAQGTGLGLYISKLLIERMGGQIWVESIEGKGSTFSFSLPIAAEPPQEETAVLQKYEEVIEQ